MNETFELLNAVELLCQGKKEEAVERVKAVRQHYNFDGLEEVSQINELDYAGLSEARSKMTVKQWKQFLLAVMTNLASTTQIIGKPDNPDWLEMFLLYSKPGDISKAIDKVLDDE